MIPKSSRPITLVLNQRARLEFKMKVGAVTNTVQVTSEAPQLQADTTQVSTLIDCQHDRRHSAGDAQLRRADPAGARQRSPRQLTLQQRRQHRQRWPPVHRRSIASSPITSSWTAWITTRRRKTFWAITPSPDAIQEFNLITSNAPAEFGNFQGGIVNASIKSGTNQFHGDVWEFFRNNVLNANQWENKFNGPGNFLPRAALRWNMFGGTLGGPVWKDKLFFFADYQGQRFDHPTTSNFITVFTNAERNGDFSQLTTQLKNPITGAPYVGNQIPMSQINPVAAALFASKYYPTPINGNLTNNAINQTNSAFNTDQGDAKIDWNITQKDRLSARWAQAYQNDPSSNSLLILGNRRPPMLRFTMRLGRGPTLSARTY